MIRSSNFGSPTLVRCYFYDGLPDPEQNLSFLDESEKTLRKKELQNQYQLKKEQFGKIAGLDYFEVRKGKAVYNKEFNKKGKEEFYAFDEKERNEILKRLKVNGKGNSKELLDEKNLKGVNISRYKGLGEMNPEQLWSTTMNPETRTVMQVTIESAAAADKIFETLMGDEVEPRREFIEKNAKYVKNLDI